MPDQPSDYIQDGTVTEYGADGYVSKVQPLNPQQLATEASRDQVLDYCQQNVPEGSHWGYIDIHLQMNNAHVSYNCPEWQVKAANGQLFNAGELFHNLFGYANPTASVVDELHKLAGAAKETT
jgi:hypothetical protein